MACRFIEADDELIELLKCESENKNTKRSTGYWKGIFEKWAKTRGKEEQLESYDIPELNEALPKCEIKNITGHNFEQGLDDYDSGDENEQKIMSNIIDNAKPASTSRQVLHPLSSVQTQSRSASSHVYNFSHCNVTLNVAGNHSLQSSLSQSKRAYKRIMLQDSDSD